MAGFSTLSGLSDLERLAFGCKTVNTSDTAPFPFDVLQHLPKLTHLQVMRTKHTTGDQAFSNQPVSLHSLHALTGLQLLQLQLPYPASVPAGALSSVQLTQLLIGYSVKSVLEPAALAGQTHLKHLKFTGRLVPEGAAGVAQLLEQLLQLTQLTTLCLIDCLLQPPEHAVAYQALTASSELRELKVMGVYSPADAWLQTFPAGRQMPHLQRLTVDWRVS